MAGDLHFSDAVYGFGGPYFFLRLFRARGAENLRARTRSAHGCGWPGSCSPGGSFRRRSCSLRAMRWGPVAAAFGCTDAQLATFLMFLRFLLGAAEAGFYPGVILYLTFCCPADYRARTAGRAVHERPSRVSNLIGSPLSGAILQFADGPLAPSGWQWLFLLEAIPALLLAVLFLASLPDGPRTARWLGDTERAVVLARLERDAGAQHGSAAPERRRRVHRPAHLGLRHRLFLRPGLLLRRQFLDADDRPGARHPQGRLPAGRPGQHDSAGLDDLSRKWPGRTILTAGERRRTRRSAPVAASGALLLAAAGHCRFFP